MTKVITPPDPISTNNWWISKKTPSIFLAGSIEMDTAEEWQDRAIKELSEFDIEIYNPRRKNWDSDINQSIDDPRFKEQVEWELKALENSSLIIIYFDPNTKSPISLLELGLFCRESNVIVCCPTGFWRKGNVDIVCQRYGVKVVETFEELISLIKSKIMTLEN